MLGHSSVEHPGPTNPARDQTIQHPVSKSAEQCIQRFGTPRIATPDDSDRWCDAPPTQHQVTDVTDPPLQLSAGLDLARRRSCCHWRPSGDRCRPGPCRAAPVSSLGAKGAHGGMANVGGNIAGKRQAWAEHERQGAARGRCGESHRVGPNRALSCQVGSVGRLKSDGVGSCIGSGPAGAGRVASAW
jgi:hypothetical protein